MDIHLSKYFNRPVHHKRFTEIFERGIDPDVDNPMICHQHSCLPENKSDWPTLSEIRKYQDDIRDAIVEANNVNIESRRLARLLFMVTTFSHKLTQHSFSNMRQCI